MTVQEIYQVMDGFAPFSTQEKWDNSGLLVGTMQQKVTGVMLALDISADVIEQAKASECNLIVAHHPVIFEPLRNLSPEHPVYQLAALGISAICSHTPMDAANGGINAAMMELLRNELPFDGDGEPIEASGIGRIITLKEAVSADTAAEAFRKCCPAIETIRLYQSGKPVSRLGFCSGSGASLIEELSGRCDMLVTGDVKHDRWYKAQELGISLADCGHFETEIIFTEIVRNLLSERFPELKVLTWKGGVPYQYV